MIRCLECFSVFDEELVVCPYCGTVEVTAVEPIHLPVGMIMENRYVIGRAIGAGGFGIIYKAWDLKLECVVAIKEFYPSKFAQRAQGTLNVIVNDKFRDEYDYRRERFLAEARNMARFSSHKNIPNVFEFFEANNTAYIVMELLNGSNLSEYMQSKPNGMDSRVAIHIINEIGKALKALHDNGIIHRDVAPDNIFVCTETPLTCDMDILERKDIRIKLLDFGAAKLTDSDDSIVDIILKPGYSPIEQYDDRKDIDATADLYALGATLYYLLTGVKPDESTNRRTEDNVLPPRELNSNIGINLSNAVMKAMAVFRHLRFKSVEEFCKTIVEERKVRTLAAERRLRKIRLALEIVLALAIVALGVVVVLRMYDQKRLAEQLNPTTISIWYSAAEGSDEDSAMIAIKEDFEATFEGVTLELRAIPDYKYEKEIQLAASENKLPNLFESTGLNRDILSGALPVDKVLESSQAKDCYFLEDYDDCYVDHNQVPLAVNLPLACIITNGNETCDYSLNYFRSLESLNYSGDISIENDACPIWDDMLDVNSFVSSYAFFDENGNTSAVLLTTTSSASEVESKVRMYQHHFAYYTADNVSCRYTYEWSIGAGDVDQVAASERLLSWMLGNRYQNYLMISSNDSDSIPVCKETFDLYVQNKSYDFDGIKNVFEQFEFRKEE